MSNASKPVSWFKELIILLKTILFVPPLDKQCGQITKTA
jgi:hypothetical protein